MRIMCVTIFVVLQSLLVAGRAGADELPTVAALRAKMTAANGSPLPSSYEKVAYTRSGVAGTRTTVVAGDDFRETDGFGPLLFARGRYQNQSWHQNTNGQTVLDQPDPGVAVEDTFTSTVSRVSAPSDAFVIAHMNKAGSGSKEYIDTVSYHVIRRDDVAPTGTRVTQYDDFRTVSGFTTAWHWTRRDGHPENDADYQIEALVARPIKAAEIDVAPPRRALVEFPAGKSNVELPVRLVQDKFIVRVMIDGRGLDFELDSGAHAIAIEDSVARELGLHTFSPVSDAGSAGRVASSSVIVPQMAIGELRMHDVAVSTLPGFPEQMQDVKVVGLLGFDFIAELVLRLDYEHARITASQGDPAVNLSSRGSIALDVRLGSQQPLTNVTINGATGERFLIDTGGGVGFLIDDYFARRYPQALVDRGGGGQIRNARLSGIGGRIDVIPYQLAKVQIGNVTFEDFVGYRVAERKSYAGNFDGAIGVGELRFFTVWLDYADSHIFMVPNSAGRQAMR